MSCLRHKKYHKRVQFSLEQYIGVGYSKERHRGNTPQRFPYHLCVRLMGTPILSQKMCS